MTEPTGQQHDPDHDLPVRAVIRQYREARAASKSESQARRDRVLAHPDLAKRLTQPPLSLSQPTKWSGWIPPRLLAEDACTHCNSSGGDRRCRDWPHRARFNDSATRRQLVDIASEAMARESGR